MDLLLHFKVNEGDENNINIQEYMLYGDVETKSEKCLVDEGDEVVLTEFPVPEFKNCTLMKKGDEGFYEYKDYRQGENAELAGGYAVSGILQQNGRAFRQGNMYNEIYEFRYVTKKSFDAYSWQMVETKSSYVTQLLEGTGDTREFEEDTQNSFSYAEVKAIASGNPIIKEKFEVDNEVKRLETMRRSWQKKKLQAQDDVALLPDRIETEKKYRTILAEECEYFKDEIEANNLRDTEHFTFYDVKGNEYHDLKEAWDVIQKCTKGYKLNDFKENKFVGRFMKADVLIGLGLAGEGIVIKMKTPLRTINVDSVNPVGRVNFNRMYKRINDIRYSLNKTIETIQNYEGNLKIAKEMVNKPFELQDELTSARNRQKEINKILDTSGNENSKVVVEDDLEEERNESCMEL